jgi:DNA adenine methylase
MRQNTTVSAIQTEVEPRPFLKWAGGKTSILSEIMSSIPTTFERYVEPFLGGGAVFFKLNPHRALLSDSNEELMNCYSLVRDRPDDLLRLLRIFSISKTKFYEVRKLDPANLDNLTRAARLIYLNKLCYNGLYRVNKKGQFNTPYSGYRNVKLADRETILAASSALKHAELLTADFARILLDLSQPGDFFYLDPPYPPIGKYSDFKRYTKAFFNKEDHIRLAKAVHELDRRGNKFLLSNANHPLILELYSRFRKKSVEAPRFVNCKGDRRGRVPELLVTNV